MASSSNPLRVTCPLCKTTSAIEPDEVGSVITCLDCLEEFVARPEASSAPEESSHVTSPRLDENDNESLQRLLNPSLDDAASDTGTSDTGTSDTGTIRLDDDAVQDQPKRPKVPAENYEFSLACRICGTRIDLDDTQIGKQVKCPDCHSELDVREPHPSKRRSKAVESTPWDGDELKLQDLPAESESNPSLYHSLADDLLESAKTPRVTAAPAASTTSSEPAPASFQHEPREVEEEEYVPPELPARPFRDGIISFLYDPTSIAWLIVLSVGVFLEFGAIQAAISLAEGEGIQQFLSILSRMFAVIFGVAVGAAISVSMQGILEDTSNGSDTIESWPDLNFLDWIGESLFIFGALFVSVFPAAVIAKVMSWLGAPAAVVWTILFGGGGLGAIILFPFVLLSMLEAGSPLVPVSQVMVRSIGLTIGRWLIFLILSVGLVSGLAFVGFGRIIWSDSTFGNALFALLLVLLSAFYFRLLGRLAWCCQDAIAEADAELDEEAGAKESASGRPAGTRA